MITPEQLLAAVRVKLADPAHWTKDEIARLPDGTPTTSRDPAAVCWCLVGAMGACLPQQDVEPHATYVINNAKALIRQRLRAKQNSSTVVWFNDRPETTHADIMEILA